MRVRKLLAFTLAVMLVLGSFTFAFGDGGPYGDDNSLLDEYEMFYDNDDNIDGDFDDEVGEGEYTVKDTPDQSVTGSSFVLPLGNGYKIELNYEMEKDDDEFKRTKVEYNIIEDGNLSENYNLSIDFIIVKASSDHNLYQSPDEDGEYFTVGKHNISHVLIAYTFTLKEQPTGSITINKIVDNVDNDKEEFGFTITGPDNYEDTFTLTEDSDPEIFEGLGFGDYIIAEDDKSEYMEDKLSETVTINGDKLNHTVTFYNTLIKKELEIEKTVVGGTHYGIGDDVIYKIVVTNKGNVDLDDVVINDLNLNPNYMNSVSIAAGKSFEDTITTSYDTTGDKENTASAEFGVDTDDDYIYVDDSVTVHISEETPVGNLLLTKNIYRDEGAVHEGVNFTLTGDGGTFTGTTDDNGNILFEDIPAGVYTLSETVPDGFTTDFDSEVTIVPWETNYVTDQEVGMPLYNNEVKVLNKMIENKRIQYEYEGNTIKGYKLDSYEDPIEDWTIELYDETEENLLDTTTTDENGMFQFNERSEGTYVVREVMQEGWFNQTPISQTIVVEGSGDVEEGYYNLPGDGELVQIMPDANVEFVAEGRIGDLDGSAEHELNIHTPPYNVEEEYRYFDWSNNGVPVPFTLDFDGTTVTYTVDGETLTYVPESVGDITDIMIRTKATKTDTGVMINNLVLNDTPLDGTSVAVGDTTDIDVLWLNGYDLSQGFTLEGESVMYWPSDNMPERSHLAYQIKVGSAANSEGTFWADTFMNEEEASITVYKEINGTQTQDPFNFKVYKGDEIINEEGYIEAQTSVSVGEPETIGLAAGTYTIAEDPDIEGYLLPDPLTFTIEAGEQKDITLTNTEIIPDRPSMTINKTADDYSVYVNEDVTYTIAVTNNGDVDLDDVWVTDDMFDFKEKIELLGIGETETFTMATSFDTPGNKSNTATAEYGSIETENHMMVDDSVIVDVNRRPSTNNTYRMKIDKVADGNFYEVGDTIEYTITVRNTGNSTLREIQVTDDMTGLEETIDFLNQGDSRKFITTYVAAEDDIGDLTNIATAEDDRAGTEEADETVTVEGVPESIPGTYEITIDKTAVTEGDIFFGDMVEFEIVVTNTGNETLTNIIVEDDMVDFEAVINNLKPGNSREFKVKVEAPNVPGPFINTATATSTETGTLEDEDMVWVTEELTPQAVPDTGVAPTDLFFGLGALVSGLGVFFTKKRK